MLLLAFGWLLAPAGMRAATPVYTLDECLAIALKQNPDILAAAKRVDAAKATIVQARAAVFPTLTSNSYFQEDEQSLATNGGQSPTYRKEDYTADARVTQNLYSAGAVRSRIAIAEMQARAEGLNYKAAIDTVALNVRTAFFQTLFSESDIDIRQQAVDLLGAQVTDQKDRLAAGSVSQINVNRAQVSLVNEQPALEQARYSLRAAYVQLSQILAIPFAESADALPFRIRGELALVPMRLTLSDCLRKAEENRPEIAARQLAIDAAKRQIIVEKSATRPQINVFAAYDLYSEPDLRATNANFSGYTVGVTANWLIFDGFATLGRVRAARAQVGIAEAALTAMRQQVQAEVRTAYYQLEEAEATLKPQAENIRLANENLQLTTTNLDAGLANQLEELQGRVDLTRAQSTELGGRLTYNNAIARLRRAMGDSGLPSPATAAPGLAK
jgi:outer membrane protein TolC